MRLLKIKNSWGLFTDILNANNINLTLLFNVFQYLILYLFFKAKCRFK